MDFAHVSTLADNMVLLVCLFMFSIVAGLLNNDKEINSVCVF